MSRGGRRSEHHAPGYHQQTGFVEEIEPEGSSSRQVQGGPSSSRHIGVELTARNLARLDDQPLLVRGPLERLDKASRQFTKETHRIKEEIDQLDHLIASWEERAESLRQQIARLQITPGDAETIELKVWLLEQQRNTADLVEQIRQAKQSLLTKLDGRGDLIDRGLRGLNLMVSRRGSGSNLTLSRYPTHIDLTEHGEVVPEEDRPW